MMNKTFTRMLAGLTLLGAATVASAHTGHGTHSLSEGLTHPMGMDHLLAMVTVGLWSATALAPARRWIGPTGFLGAMTLGAALGAAGWNWAGTEAAIALSVLLFGLMLVWSQRLSASVGMGVVLAGAMLHGLAHGAELPWGGSFAAYATGFLTSSALLQVAGLGCGLRLTQARAVMARRLPVVLGGLTATAGGLLLMARI